MHHAFRYISLPSLHDYDVNCLISRFIDNVNIRRRILLSLFNLNIFLKNSTVGKFAGQPWTISASWDNRAAVSKNARSHILSDVFTVVAVVVSETPYGLDHWYTVEPPVSDHPKCKD